MTNSTRSSTYLNKEHIGQTHSECAYNSDFSVILTNTDKALKTQIVDRDGLICKFPGIENCKELCAETDVKKLRPIVVYSTTFQRCENGHFLMIWTVRPDGRFWMDSWGFGAEDYESLKLYSYIDENGQFTAPFRLYSIGCCKFIDNSEE